MGIIKKKYETFDVDYQKEINGNTYDIVGQVVVRLSDKRIESLCVNIFADKTNPSNALTSINYYESVEGVINCNISANDGEMIIHEEIISEIKKELYSTK